jgi:hypothetical protein
VSTGIAPGGRPRSAADSARQAAYGQERANGHQNWTPESCRWICLPITPGFQSGLKGIEGCANPYSSGRLHVTRDLKGYVMLEKSRSSKEKVRLHRERLRAQGLRPVQIWVPDVRARSFAKAARQQSKIVAEGTGAKNDQKFVDAISDQTEE